MLPGLQTLFDLAPSRVAESDCLHESAPSGAERIERLVEFQKELLGDSGWEMARALRYLDSSHDGHRLRKVVSQVRRPRDQELVARTLDERGPSEAGEPMA